jgi:anti-sigma factor RsiW
MDRSDTPSSLTCRDTTLIVSAARDAEVSDEELAALARHLETCERCQAARRQFTQLFQALDDLLARPPAP